MEDIEDIMPDKNSRCFQIKRKFECHKEIWEDYTNNIWMELIEGCFDQFLHLCKVWGNDPKDYKIQTTLCERDYGIDALMDGIVEEIRPDWKVFIVQLDLILNK